MPEGVAVEIAEAVGSRRVAHVEKRLAEAMKAFDGGRPYDAWQVLRPLTKEAAAVPAVREMAGLALYRLGRWRAAIKELEAYRQLTSSVDQNPVLADCYRALKRYTKVNKLWDELRAASPSRDLLVEGRIVAAGALADQEDVAGAVSLLERGAKSSPNRRRPQPSQLRLLYALADLYERAGDAPRARELFARVAAASPEITDAPERLKALR